MVYEIGDDGVIRLIAASFSFDDEVEAKGAAWAREYLYRAGLKEAEGGVILTLPRARLEPQGYEEALAAIRGCYLAAEAIKEVIGYGERGELEEALNEVLEDL